MTGSMASGAFRPAGQTAVAASSNTTPAPAGIGPDGRIAGIDGMLDQIAGALVRQATPYVQSQILPALQSDRALQMTVGAAAGQAAAQTLRPWVILGTVSLAAIAITSIVAASRKTQARRTTRRRSRRTS